MFNLESPSTQHKSVVFSYFNYKLIMVSCVNTHQYSNNKINYLIKQQMLNSNVETDINLDDLNINIKNYVVAKFFNEDEALMFESFCIRKFSPILNTTVNFIDDLVFVKNTKFVGDEHKYDNKYAYLNSSYKHISIGSEMSLCCLLIDLDYPIKLVSDVIGVSVQEIESMLYRLEEYSDKLLPYEYISYDNRVLVDKRLLRHFRMLFKSVVDSVDAKYSVLSIY